MQASSCKCAMKYMKSIITVIHFCSCLTLRFSQFLLNFYKLKINYFIVGFVVCCDMGVECC